MCSIAVIGGRRGCRLDPFEPLIRCKRPHRTKPFIPRIANRSSDSQGLSNGAPHVIGPNSSDNPGRSGLFLRGAFDAHITLAVTKRRNYATHASSSY